MKDTLVQLWASAEPGPPLLPLPPGLTEWCATHQRFARVRPPIRVRFFLVVVLHIPPQTLLEFLNRSEVASPQELTCQHAEPHLHLIQPRAVPRQVVEVVLVLAVAQPRPSLFLRLQFLC